MDYRKAMLRKMIEIREVLPCQICLEVAKRYTHQCLEGHLLCETCGSKPISTCPTCTSPIVKARSRVAEQIGNLLWQPCPYASDGCKDIIERSEITKHSVECPFRTFTCALGKCQWNGSKLQLREHLERSHSSVLTYNNKIVNVPRRGIETWYCILFHDNEFYKIYCQFDEAKDFLLGTAMRYGQSGPTERFKFKMSLSSDMNDVGCTRYVQAESSDRNEMFARTELVARIHSCYFPPGDQDIKVKFSIEETKSKEDMTNSVASIVTQLGQFCLSSYEKMGDMLENGNDNAGKKIAQTLKNLQKDLPRAVLDMKGLISEWKNKASICSAVQVYTMLSARNILKLKSLVAMGYKKNVSSSVLVNINARLMIVAALSYTILFDEVSSRNTELLPEASKSKLCNDGVIQLLAAMSEKHGPIGIDRVFRHWAKCKYDDPELILPQDLENLLAQARTIDWNEIARVNANQ